MHTAQLAPWDGPFFPLRQARSTVAVGESTNIGPRSPRRSVTDNDLMAMTLASLAAFLIALWGFAHTTPTRQVLVEFQPITQDNRLVMLQEWLAEAFTMWGLAGIIVSVTIVGAGAGSHTSQWAYRAVAALLVALAILTGLTGARTPVIWFKICPVLLTFSAVLLLAASLI